MGCGISSDKIKEPCAARSKMKQASLSQPTPQSSSAEMCDRNRPYATESEILSQLAQEGIIPIKRRQGGVEYSFPNINNGAKRPSPFLEKLPRRIQYMNLEERMMLADIQRHNHLAKRRETVRRNNIKAQQKAKEKRHRSENSGLKQILVTVY